MALGGTAYAAATITGAEVVDESLTTLDVKGKGPTSTVAGVNGSLTGADISGQGAIASLNQPAVDGSLTTYDIKDATLKAVDLADGSVTSSKVADNTLTGADIDETTLAGVRLSGYEVVSSTFTNPTRDPSHYVTCPAGKKAVGGGFGAAVITPNGFYTTAVKVAYSNVSQLGGWTAQVDFGAPAAPGDNHALTVEAVCVNASP